MPYLQILKGSNQGQWLPLDRALTILGRDPNCSIVLRSTDAVSEKQNSVSREHAVVSLCAGQFYIEDGNGNGRPSRNHTYVNGNHLPFPKKVLLRDGDVIKICDFSFKFFENALDPSKEPTSPSSIDASLSHDSSLLLAQPAEKLKLLLEITNRLSNNLDQDLLLPQVVETLLQIFKQADRGFLILVDESTGGLVPRSVKIREPRDDAQSGFSTSIVEQCLQRLDGLLSNDVRLQFPGSDSVAGLSLFSVMCAPLWSERKKALGVLLLDSQKDRRKFTQEDLNLLMAVASQASIALANARYHREALARERLKRDLALAREVVKSFLPASLPDIPGYEFFAVNESALEVGGDYYDFIPLSGKRLGIMVGDVAGKGVAAALVMSRFSAEARACLRTEAHLAKAISQLNTLMQPLNLTDRFVTLTALVLDPATQTLMVVNAGHPSPLLLRRATGALEEIAPRSMSGPPIGVQEDYVYEAYEIVLQPEDVLVLFSDGITESRNVMGKELGARGLRAVLQAVNAPPRGMGDRILQAIKDHATGCDQHDDITLVCLGRLA